MSITIHDIWEALNAGKLDEEIPNIRLALDLRESLLSLPLKEGSKVKVTGIDWIATRNLVFEVKEIIDAEKVRLQWPDDWKAGSRRNQTFIVTVGNLERA